LHLADERSCLGIVPGDDSVRRKPCNGLPVTVHREESARGLDLAKKCAGAALEVINQRWALMSAVTSPAVMVAIVEVRRQRVRRGFMCRGKREVLLS